MANPTDERAPSPASMGRTPGITPGGLVPQPDNGAPPDTRVGTIPGDTTLNPIQEFRQAGRRPSIVSAPQGPDIAGHDPVLFTDIEGVYLARLYPGHFADAGNAAADAAIEQGKRVQEQGRELVADQQSPINWEGENRPSEGPGPGGEQAGRPWDEQEAQRRGREARTQQEQQRHPHEQVSGQQSGQPGQDQQQREQQERERQQREQQEQRERQEREERERREREQQQNIPPGREA